MPWLAAKASGLPRCTMPAWLESGCDEYTRYGVGGVEHENVHRFLLSVCNHEAASGERRCDCRHAPSRLTCGSGTVPSEKRYRPKRGVLRAEAATGDRQRMTQDPVTLQCRLGSTARLSPGSRPPRQPPRSPGCSPNFRRAQAVLLLQLVPSNCGCHDPARPVDLRHRRGPLAEAICATPLRSRVHKGAV